MCLPWNDYCMVDNKSFSTNDSSPSNSKCNQVCALCKKQLSDDKICSNNKCDAYNECPDCGYHLDKYNACLCMSEQDHLVLSGEW